MGMEAPSPEMPFYVITGIPYTERSWKKIAEG